MKYYIRNLIITVSILLCNGCYLTRQVWNHDEYEFIAHKHSKSLISANVEQGYSVTASVINSNNDRYYMVRLNEITADNYTLKYIPRLGPIIGIAKIIVQKSEDNPLVSRASLLGVKENGDEFVIGFTYRDGSLMEIGANNQVKINDDPLTKPYVKSYNTTLEVELLKKVPYETTALGNLARVVITPFAVIGDIVLVPIAVIMVWPTTSELL